MTPKKYYAEEIGEFIARFRFDDLPPGVISKAKACILDNLGLVIGGSSSAAGRAVLQTVRELGSAPETHVLRYGDRVAAPHAALVNGTMAHSNDYTDTILESVVHAGPVVVPTALAEVERGAGGGRELIAAVVLGYEITGRVAAAVNSKPRMGHHAKGFHPTGTAGVFGAAATSAWVRRLDAAKAAHALGIAGSSAAGLIESFTGPTGAMTFRTHPGKAGHDGILAAMFASHGLTGPASVFEGRDGFLRAYTEAEAYVPERLTRDLGTRFMIMDVAVKYHNGTHAVASSIDALQAILKDHAVEPDEIEEIVPHIPRMHSYIWDSTKETMYTPPTYEKAQMSLPYTLAVALLDGEVGVAQYREARLRDSHVLACARKVRPVVDEDIDRRMAAGQWPATVEIRLRGGKRLRASVDYPRGSPQNLLSDAELEQKFRRLTDGILAKERADRVVGTVRTLEELSRCSELVASLCVAAGEAP